MKGTLKQVMLYLLIFLLISLTVLVIQELDSFQLPKVVQDINSGVIGAILTTIITLLLLANQSEIQENQTKNSVIYEEKLKMFNDFLQVLNESLIDGKLTAAEMKKIIFSFSVIRIHLSKEGANKIADSISNIDNEFFFVDENYVPNFDKYIDLYHSICNVLREELYANNKEVALDRFNFDNFMEIAYKRRQFKVPVDNIDKAIQYYRENPAVLSQDAEGTNIYFKLSNELIDSIKGVYTMVDELIAAQNQPNVTQRFIFNQNTINSKIYLGKLNVKYSVNNHEFATFAISEKNRLFFKIKFAKPVTFTFEDDTPFEEFRAEINMELQRYFSMNNKTT